MCLLSQNIINEKLYLFLWFWFVFVLTVCGVQIVFEVCMFAIPSFRSYMFTRHTGSPKNGSKMKRFIERCQHGDWFLLYQIGKNTSREFFYDLVDELAKEELGRTKKGEFLELNDVHTDLNLI